MPERVPMDDAGQRYRQLLLSILPSVDDTCLLRACLLSGAEAEEAWRVWRRRVTDPKIFMERDDGGLKGLLPFLRHALTKNEIGLDEEFQTYLRVSTLREELRSEIFRNITGEVLSAMRTADIRVIALKGAALSETVYDHPDIRHNHAIDLLVNETDLTAAEAALSHLPFTADAAATRDRRQHRAYTHDTGLPLVLHSQLFLLPYYHSDLSALWQRALPARIAGRETLILDAADNLLHVCGHASYSQSRSNLRWVCDAFYILRRKSEIDWPTVVSEAAAQHLVMPLSIMLDYLEREFRAPVPKQVMTELSAIPMGADSAAAEAALASVTIGVSPGKALRRLSGSWPEKRQVLRFLLFPPRDYVRWRYGISNPLLLPAVYAYRPLKYLIRRILRIFRRNSQQQAASV